MNTDIRERTFNKFLSDIGGIFREEYADKTAWNILNQHLDFFRYIIKSDKPADNYNPVGDLYVNFVNNESLNAVAFQYGEEEYVGIYAGTLFNVYDIFYSLLAHPEILSQIGDSSTERNTYTSIAKRIKRKDTHKYFEILPKNRVRRRTAAHLAFNVLNFFFGHEIGHIVDGHIYRLNSKFKIDRHFEYNDNPNKALYKANLTNHLLEFGADKHGTRVSLKLWGMFSENGIGLDGQESPISKSPDQYIYLWAYSIGIMFRIFDIKSNHFKESSFSSHPGPHLRYYHFIISGLEIVKDLRPDLENIFQDSTQKASEDLDNLWRNLEIPTINFDLTDKSIANLVGEQRLEFYDFQKKELRPFQQIRSNLINKC